MHFSIKICSPNGSGKSTFAKILAGIERADDRRAIFSGVTVGYLPQKSFPFRMSTEKNILQNGNDPARAAALMKALGIEALAGQSAKKLSGGETARAFIDEIRAMNKRMNIPAGFDFIREKDIPQMITWALAEANPVYPVPVVYDRKRCDKVIRRILAEA